VLPNVTENDREMWTSLRFAKRVGRKTGTEYFPGGYEAD